MIVSRDKTPALYSLVDQVATVLNLPPIDGIVIKELPNTAIATFGWQRRTVLMIGLPLWGILDDQERVALIAHELAHYYNDDVSLTLLISAAMATLGRWYALLLPPDMAPSPLVPIYRRTATIQVKVVQKRLAGESLVSLFLAGLANISLALIFVLRYLFTENSKYAEYLADRVAANIA